MSKKSAAIAETIRKFQGQKHDAHYLAYFDCFNRQLYFEAHDVLEQLWLADRSGPDYSFYKGLIQLAGAFVHLQKNRLRPAAALFKLAETNLRKYPSPYADLNLKTVLVLIENWLELLNRGNFQINPIAPQPAPKLGLCEGL